MNNTNRDRLLLWQKRRKLPLLNSHKYPVKHLLEENEAEVTTIIITRGLEVVQIVVTHIGITVRLITKIVATPTIEAKEAKTLRMQGVPAITNNR